MNKKHRIFIAINLPVDVKKYLGGVSEKYSEFPAKWTPEENLHITLLFLGDLTDEQMGKTCLITKQVAACHESFELRLKNIGYWPNEKLPPRMIWVSGEKSKELSELKRDLENSLCDEINLRPDFKMFSPHITLARVSAFGFRQINSEERPEIAQDIDLFFDVASIEVMESEMKRGGPRYEVIESCELKLNMIK